MHYVFWVFGSLLGMIVGAALGGFCGYDAGLWVGHRIASHLVSGQIVDAPETAE